MQRVVYIPILLALLIFSGPAFGAEPFQVTPLPFARNMHGSVIVRNYLFVFGGDTPAGFTPTVQMARVNTDRSLGPWLDSKAMPVNLIYIGNSVVQANNTIYVCGGQQVQDTENPSVYLKEDSNKVYWSRVGADTMLADWQVSDAWPAQQSLGTTAVLWGERLYIIGGGETESQEVSARVFSASINKATGALGAWREESPLPQSLWFHGAFARDGRVYTAGGRTGVANETTVNTVYTADVGEEGVLSEWQTASSTMPSAVSSAASCATDSYLFLFCGMQGDGILSGQIQFSSVTGNGISRWGDVRTAMLAKYYASAASSDEAHAIYISGGRSTTFYRDMNRLVYCYPLKAKTADRTAPAKTGFLDLASAAALAGNEKRGMLLFFYSDRMVVSRSLLDSLNQSTTFFDRISDLVPAAINTSENPELAQRYKVVRVPTIVLLDENGAYIRSTEGLLSEREIINFIHQQ